MAQTQPGIKKKKEIAEFKQIYLIIYLNRLFNINRKRPGTVFEMHKKPLHQH